MKVNKEEILGMFAALERYLRLDHAKEWQLWEEQVEHIAARVRAIPGVETEIHVPPIANHVPSLRVSWDAQRVHMAPAEAREALRNGKPSIETMGGDTSIDITTWMMKPREERIVARRLYEVLRSAAT
jgi:L-seryl-tRNA(Ser) seleniumtransferase